MDEMKTFQNPERITKAQSSSQASRELHGDQKNGPSTDFFASDLDSVSISNSNRRRVAWEDVEHVKNLIQSCLQQYVDKKDAVEILLIEAGIEPEFTTIIWQSLEMENSDFFRVYYTRLAVKRQIMRFNELLQEQIYLMNILPPVASYQNNIHSVPLLPNEIHSMPSLQSGIPLMPVGCLSENFSSIQQPPMQALADPQSFLQQPHMLAMAEPHPFVQQLLMPAMDEPHTFVQQPLMPAMDETHPFIQQPLMPSMVEPHPFAQQPVMQDMAESHHDSTECGLCSYHVDNGVCAPGSSTSLSINSGNMVECSKPDLQLVVPSWSTMSSNSEIIVSPESVASNGHFPSITTVMDTSVFDSRSLVDIASEDRVGSIRDSFNSPKRLCNYSASNVNNCVTESRGALLKKKRRMVDVLAHRELSMEVDELEDVFVADAKSPLLEDIEALLDISDEDMLQLQLDSPEDLGAPGSYTESQVLSQSLNNFSELGTSRSFNR